MICGVFGLPRCGKTTYLQHLAYRERMRILTGKSNFDRIISTSPLWGAELVRREDILDYRWCNTLILIDEVSLFFGSREFKQFGIAATEVFAMHGHRGNTIYWCSQKVDDVDLKIWSLTEKLVYSRKGMLFRWVTCFYPCRHIVTFDDKTKRPIQGFNPPSVITKLFHLRLDRRPYYRLFDTHAELEQFNKSSLSVGNWLS